MVVATEVLVLELSSSIVLATEVLVLVSSSSSSIVLATEVLVASSSMVLATEVLVLVASSAASIELATEVLVAASSPLVDTLVLPAEELLDELLDEELLDGLLEVELLDEELGVPARNAAVSAGRSTSPASCLAAAKPAAPNTNPDTPAATTTARFPNLPVIRLANIATSSVRVPRDRHDARGRSVG